MLTLLLLIFLLLVVEVSKMKAACRVSLISMYVTFTSKTGGCEAMPYLYSFGRRTRRVDSFILVVDCAVTSELIGYSINVFPLWQMHEFHIVSYHLTISRWFPSEGVENRQVVYVV